MHDNPKERAVTAQETKAEEIALAKLSLRHALICCIPARTEHEPTAPAINEKISRYSVDVFPSKYMQLKKKKKKKHSFVIKQAKFLKSNNIYELRIKPYARKQIQWPTSTVTLAVDELIKRPSSEAEDDDVHDEVDEEKRAEEAPAGRPHGHLISLVWLLQVDFMQPRWSLKRERVHGSCGRELLAGIYKLMM